VQRIERRLFGPDHPDNANTLNKIGRAYANKGLFYQAMEKHQQALQVLKACVGENLSHPAVCETLIHIGEVYYRERNSLSTIRNNADDYKRFIETGMLDIIARAHEGRGSYKIALGFLEEKLQLIKNEKSDFPKDQLARLLYNVGTLSCKSGVFLEAIDYYEQALDIQMQQGCNDVDVATAKVLIGTVEFHIGQYRKSLNLLEGALAVFEKEFGSEHEVVADTLHRIGIVKAALWHLDDAMDNLERALNLQLKLFGENDLEVLQTRLEICWIEMNQGETDNVAAHVKGIMQKQQSLVGKSHPIVADTLLLLGKAYLLADNSSKAVKAFQESFHMRERFLGRDHPLQAEAFHLIAIEGIRREKFQHSLGMCNSVLNIRRETLGERHLDVASTLSSIGRCYAGVGKFVEAFRSFDDALQIAQESVGENHPCVGDIYVGKGSLYLRKCQFRSAKESIDKGIEIYRTVEIHEYHDRMKAATKLLEKVVRDEMLCV
jgi:tetratricopeptide (TPR) repeat protein